MKLVLNKNITRICVLAVLMFSATALYTIETTALYILITGICMLYAGLQVARRPYIFQTFLNTNGFLWASIFLTFVAIDAAFRTQKGELNFDFILFTWISIAVVIIIFLSCKSSKELLNVFCRACEISTILICGYILITEAGGVLREDGRLGEGLSGNVITVSMHLGFYSFGILHLYVVSKKKRHLLIYAVCCVFMLLTGSKVALFYFACAAVYYLKSCPPSKRGKRVIIFIIIIAISLAFIFTNQQLYRIIGKRIQDFLFSIGLFSKGSASRSTNMRLDLLEFAWKKFLESPIWGHGFNSVAKMPPYYVYSHNNFLELLANNGIIGFALYYGFYLSQLLTIVRYRKKDATMLLLCILLCCDLLRDITQIVYTAGWVCYGSVIFCSTYLKLYRKEQI